MTRRRISTKARVELFNAHKGRCHICSQKIAVGEAWDVEHVVPLALGGSDEVSNLSPAHRACHSPKTKDDVGQIAKAKRQEARHLGAKAESRNPLPGSRRSPFRKKLSGEVVRRDDGARHER